MVFLLFSASVFAEDKEELCSFTHHVPDSDVNYKPDPLVAPADLNPNPFILPERIAIPLTIDVAKFTGITVPDGLEAQGQLGLIEVDTKTNELFYNGESITRKIEDYCEHKNNEQTK